MQEAFFSFISQFGYFAVAGLILFENVFPPIPSELILPLSGFLATQTAMTLPGVIVAATVGSVVGAYFLYGIGRLLSQERLEGFFDTKPMRMLGFHSDDVAKAIGWFDRKGQIVIDKEECDMDADELMMAALDAGAEDFSEEEDSYEVITDPDNFSAVREALEKAGIPMVEADITMIPQNWVELTDEESIKKMQRILDLLDEDDDVQATYHNWDE